MIKHQHHLFQPSRFLRGYKHLLVDLRTPFPFAQYIIPVYLYLVGTVAYAVLHISLVIYPPRILSLFITPLVVVVYISGVFVVLSTIAEAPFILR